MDADSRFAMRSSWRMLERIRPTMEEDHGRFWPFLNPKLQVLIFVHSRKETVKTVACSYFLCRWGASSFFDKARPRHFVIWPCRMTLVGNAKLAMSSWDWLDFFAFRAVLCVSGLLRTRWQSSCRKIPPQERFCKQRPQIWALEFLRVNSRTHASQSHWICLFYLFWKIQDLIQGKILGTSKFLCFSCFVLDLRNLCRHKKWRRLRRDRGNDTRKEDRSLETKTTWQWVRDPINVFIKIFQGDVLKISKIVNDEVWTYRNKL